MYKTIVILLIFSIVFGQTIKSNMMKINMADNIMPKMAAENMMPQMAENMMPKMAAENMMSKID